MVERTALEMRRTREGTVGSNPTLSASFTAGSDKELAIIKARFGGLFCCVGDFFAKVKRPCARSAPRPTLACRSPDGPIAASSDCLWVQAPPPRYKDPLPQLFPAARQMTAG